MKIILMSMPDVAPVMMHETAFHMPNCGIASVGANIDEGHEVFIIDLIRKRRRLRKYLTKTLQKIRPDLVGLSAMAWQYDTCTKLVKLIKHLLPEVKIVIGGYHATLMNEEIAASPEAEWIDFMIRGEGEEACRRLINALEGKDRLEDIDSLSYKRDQHFVHNPRGELLDLSRLRLPIRDKRRLTWGYHIMNSKIEVMETSRGCTRACTYCSIRHMYGKSFRTFPIERVLTDLDDIYYTRKTRWVFIADDNLVLDPEWVIEICDAIIARDYKKLNIVVQADCISMAKNEEMVHKMALAGIRSVFLGIENVSKKNLATAHKGDIVDASRKAVENCHKYGIMVMGGLIFGFPDDDEQAIIENYKFLKSTGADTAYCQILTPYPKTEMRRQLLDQGLVTNIDDYKWYNGLWANVKTKHLESDRLQYLFWYHKQTVLGWWEPSERIRSQGRFWTGIWLYAFRPMLKFFIGRSLKKYGWEGRYQRAMKRLAGVNVFQDVDL
ncbi:MAG: B12-binding domain-containing radical SAM protein [Deltaproteobacteria bacterium]|nr:B12-binding domain-containing radical SAM protein [Deltaproteobacteria bacterium]